jgi:hypothetical protein
MQISIFNDSGHDVLVHGPVRAAANYASGPIGEITFEDEPSIEVARYLRAPTASVFDRGNLVCRCAFTALREFTSTLAAQTWLAKHMLQVRRTSRLHIVEGGNVLKLTGGALGPIQAQPMGVELRLAYTWTYTGVES